MQSLILIMEWTTATGIQFLINQTLQKVLNTAASFLIVLLSSPSQITERWDPGPVYQSEGKLFFMLSRQSG